MLRAAPLALCLVGLCLAGLATLGGCAAGVVPPSRTDIATTVIADGGELTSGLRFSTGAHLASGLLRRDFPVDVGAGYVYERFEPTGSAEGVATRQTSPSSPSAGGEAMAGRVDDAHGGYLEASHVVDRGRAHRTWLGVRGEVLGRRTDDGRRAEVGGYARVAWEIYASGEGAGSFADGCGGGAGFSRGTSAIGLFVESGAQWVGEEERAAFVAMAGLSVRLPLFGGFVFNLCPKC